jgi:chromosome segregation ATPase
VVHEDGGAGLVTELRALSARLAELAHAVDSALVEAEVDAVSARVASIEATAAEHFAERQAAEERQAGLAAEEAAEVAEERAGQLAAQADQDAASIAALTRSLRAAEDRAAALTAELATLRPLIAGPTHLSGEVASGAWSPVQKRRAPRSAG